jgi:hypothetical protein
MRLSNCTNKQRCEFEEERIEAVKRLLRSLVDTWNLWHPDAISGGQLDPDAEDGKSYDEELAQVLKPDPVPDPNDGSGTPLGPDVVTDPFDQDFCTFSTQPNDLIDNTNRPSSCH